MAKVDTVRATTYLARGWRYLVTHPELWPNAVVPFIVNIVCYTAFFAAGLWFWFHFKNHILPGATGMWASMGNAVALTLVAAGVIIVFVFTYTLVGSLLAAPFNDKLARRTLETLGHRVAAAAGFTASAKRSMGNEVKKFAMFVAVEALLLLLWLWPGIGQAIYVFVAPSVTIVYLAFDFLDYALETTGMGVGRRYLYLLRHLGPASGFGASLFLASWIPLLGYFLIPVAVVSAAMLYHDIERA